MKTVLALILGLLLGHQGKKWLEWNGCWVQRGCLNRKPNRSCLKKPLVGYCPLEPKSCFGIKQMLLEYSFPKVSVGCPQQQDCRRVVQPPPKKSSLSESYLLKTSRPNGKGWCLWNSESFSANFQHLSLFKGKKTLKRCMHSRPGININDL